MDVSQISNLLDHRVLHVLLRKQHWKIWKLFDRDSIYCCTLHGILSQEVLEVRGKIVSNKKFW